MTPIEPLPRDEPEDDLDIRTEEAREQPDDLVTVATFQYAHQAELGRVHLAEAGMRGFVADAETVAMDWLIGNAIGYVKLQVARSDLPAATEVLAKHPVPPPSDTAATDADDAGEVCLSCGADIPETDSSCPACGWSYDGEDDGAITANPPTA